MVHVESRQLETVEGSLPCDVYAHRRSGRDAPTVAFIHGMSLLGHRDPRQIKVCEALAAAESMHHTSMKSLIFAFRKSLFSGSKLLYWRLSNKVRNESVFFQFHFRPDYHYSRPQSLEDKISSKVYAQLEGSATW